MAKEKYFLLVLALLAVSIPLSLAIAGEEAGTTQPVFDDGGNSVRERSINATTETVTGWFLVSSAPTRSGLGINVWRFREVVNMSNGGVFLWVNPNDFTEYKSTFGVHLATDTRGLGSGDSYVIPHQAELWGRFAPDTSTATIGAGSRGIGITETYFKR